jgi:hypothetical protein
MWGFCHHGAVRPQVTDGADSVHILMAAANVLSKQLWEADKGWSSNLEFGRGAKTSLA